MWRETKLLLIDDNLDRSRDLAVILNFLGEDQLTCNSEDWREVAAGLSNSREALCVLLGSVESKGGAVELLKQLASWDEYLPILLIGEPAPADWPALLAQPALDWSIEAWGREVGASGRTLARLFTEQTGLGFSRWRTQARLFEARRRLAEGRSVTEVAHALGYASDSAFIAMYRRVCGQSPGRALRGLE